MKKSRMLLFAIAASIFLSGCGDDEAAKELPKPPPHLRGIGSGGEGGASQADLAAVATRDDSTVPVPSEKWDEIRTDVERFITHNAYDQTNPFRNKLAEVLQPDAPAPPVEIVIDTIDETQKPKDTTQVKIHPLQTFSLENDELKLKMIMHGIAQPEAVFVDPLGRPWIVRTGTPIGNRPGQKVRSIKQYKVSVDVPDSETDIVKEIAPAILKETFESDKDTPAQPSFYAEPLTRVPVKKQ